MESNQSLIIRNRTVAKRESDLSTDLGISDLSFVLSDLSIFFYQINRWHREHAVSLRQLGFIPRYCGVSKRWRHALPQWSSTR